MKKRQNIFNVISKEVIYKLLYRKFKKLNLVWNDDILRNHARHQSNMLGYHHIVLCNISKIVCACELKMLKLQCQELCIVYSHSKDKVSASTNDLQLNMNDKIFFEATYCKDFEISHMRIVFMEYNFMFR